MSHVAKYSSFYTEIVKFLENIAKHMFYLAV